MTPLERLSAAHGRLSANLRGALWMLASALTFAVMATLIKFLGDTYSPGLQAFYRQTAALLFLAPLILSDPVGAFRTTRPGLLLYRAFAGTTGLILAFYTFQEMPLAEANAWSFTRTLWIVPLAMFVLGERVGVWRIGATLVGFVGVLVMLHPSGTLSIGAPQLAALASAALIATTITGMKMMTRDHSMKVITVWGAVLGFVLSIPFAIGEWRWPTPIDALLLAAMGGLSLVNQVCYIKGMTVGDAAAMAPMDYTRIIFAVAIGWFGFHEVPDPLAMAGAGIVIASTLFIVLREARLRRTPEPPAAV